MMMHSGIYKAEALEFVVYNLLGRAIKLIDIGSYGKAGVYCICAAQCLDKRLKYIDEWARQFTR